MRVAVTGATGTIGRAVVRELVGRGDSVVALSRDPSRANLDVEVLEWRDPKKDPAPAAAFSGVDGVVHLLGEPLAQRWSEGAKREIHDSRVLGTRNLVAGMSAASPRPAVLVSQSASGYYGPHGDEPVDESAGPGDSFEASVVADWEEEARAAEQLGMRVVLCRTGVVLSPSGGALEKMLTPFKIGVGGPVAGGDQYLPWVHIDDVVGALLFALDNDSARSDERHSAVAGHEPRLLQGARPRPPPAGVHARPGLRDPPALRRDGDHRDDGRARRAAAPTGARLRIPPAGAGGSARSGALGEHLAVAGLLRVRVELVPPRDLALLARRASEEEPIARLAALLLEYAK